MDDGMTPGDVPAGAPLTVGERIDAAARRVWAIDVALATAAAETQRLKAEREALTMRALPEMLREFGSNVWEQDGVTVKVAGKVKGALSQAPSIEAAVAYLAESGFGGALKTEVSVLFDEDEMDVATKLVSLVGTMTGKQAEIERSVHPSTLAAWANDRLRNGEPVDLERIGLRLWREASVKVK